MSMGETTMHPATGAVGEGASQGWGARLAARPLFMCGFRPFFLATVVYAVLLLLMWQGFLAAGLGVPAVPGGPVVWHAHELMFGFGLAAAAGLSWSQIQSSDDVTLERQLLVAPQRPRTHPRRRRHPVHGHDGRADG